MNTEEQPAPSKHNWARWSVLAAILLVAIYSMADWPLAFYRLRIDLSSQKQQNELVQSVFLTEPKRYRDLIIDALINREQGQSSDGKVNYKRLMLLTDCIEKKPELLLILARRYKAKPEDTRT